MKIQINSLSHDGFGIGRHDDGKIVFVPKTIPGEIVEIDIRKENAKFAQGLLKQIIKKSPDRIEAFCPFFANCGGCDFQMISYQNQLKWKETIFKDILTRIGGLADVAMIQPVIGMKGECPKFYRNKIRFAFLKNADEIKFSRHNRSNPQADIIVDKCFLQSDRSNLILTVLAKWAKENNLTIFNAQTLSGFLKYVLIREGKKTSDLMIDITTTKGRIDDRLKDDLLQRLKITFSLYQTETSGIANSRIKLNHLYGSKFIKDQIGHCTFQISHNSFFQTNSTMAETIYSTVLKFLTPKPTDIVWDLYCGTGTIGIYIAKQVSRVIGIESCLQAIDDAKINAKLNQITNIDFICDRVEDMLRHSTFHIPHSVIVDPPRAGLDDQTRLWLKKSNISRLVYVSCNPQTLARDLKDLTKDGQYQINQIQPIDCFPHTHHIESVTLLQHELTKDTNYRSID